MESILRAGMSLLLIGLAVFLCGCSDYKGPKSPYASMYTGQSTATVPLRHAEVKDKGVTRTFARALDDVWRACLQIGTQYEAIMYVANRSEGVREMIFIHGQLVVVPTPLGYAPLGYPVPVFADTWVAVSVRGISSNETEVALGWICPETGRIGPISSKSVGPGTAVRPEPGTYDAICSVFKETRRKVTRRKVAAQALARKKDLLTQLVISKFFQELAAQLLGPERWKEKFQPLSVIPSEGNHRFGESPREKTHRHAELEREMSNYISAKLQRANVVLDDSITTNLIRRIGRDLLDAAGRPERNVRVFILAAPDVNAFSLPNGDIFVYSGLLDALQDKDELAFLLGHEVDHLVGHDTLARLEELHRNEVLAGVVSVAASVGGGFVGYAGVMAVAGGSAAGAAAAGASFAAGGAASGAITSEVLAATVSSAEVSVHSSLGAVAHSAIDAGYSSQRELRADRNGVKYTRAAGYDPSAALRTLIMLKKLQAAAKETKLPIISNLISCEPGLEHRIKEMELTLEKLGVESPAQNK